MDSRFKIGDKVRIARSVHVFDVPPSFRVHPDHGEIGTVVGLWSTEHGYNMVRINIKDKEVDVFCGAIEKISNSIDFLVN